MQENFRISIFFLWCYIHPSNVPLCSQVNSINMSQEEQSWGRLWCIVSIFPNRSTIVVVVENPQPAHTWIFLSLFLWFFFILACFLHTSFCPLPRSCTTAFPSARGHVLQWLLQPFPSMAITGIQLRPAVVLGLPGHSWCKLVSAQAQAAKSNCWALPWHPNAMLWLFINNGRNRISGATIERRKLISSSIDLNFSLAKWCDLVRMIDFIYFFCAILLEVAEKCSLFQINFDI